MPDFEDKIPLSEFSVTNILHATDRVPLIQASGEDWDNFCAALLEIALWIVKDAEYTSAGLNTQSKKIIGAINEVAAQSGSVDITTEITTPAPIQTFNDGGDNIPLKSLVTEIVPIQSGSGTPSPTNPRAISGHSNCVITVSDGDNTTRNTTIPLGQTVYGGSLECVEGEGQITKAYVEFDGSSDETWYQATNGAFYIRAFTDTTWQTSKICNMYQYGGEVSSSSDVTQDKTFYAQYSQSSPQYCRLWIKDTDYATISDFTTFLASNTLQVVYGLKTPTSLSVSGANIPTLSGENNIYTDCGDIQSFEYFNENGDDIAALVRLMTRT